MNLSTELPLYESIRRELQARIDSGELREGDRIVPEIDLAKQLGVSRSTARKALQCLTDAGLISRTAGRGSFVLPKRGRGRMPGSRVLELAVCSADMAESGSELARGFLRETLSAGCAAIAWPWNADSGRWPHDANGGAVWCCGNDVAAREYARDAHRNGVPVVVIDGDGGETPCDRVDFDHEGLGATLARQLARKGIQSVAVITGPADDARLARRERRFRETLAGNGVEIRDEFVIAGRPGPNDDLRLDLFALLGRKDRPAALCCLHEGLSGWVAETVKELGYTCGNDIELALATANTEQTAGCITAHLDVTSAGREAAKMLLRRIESPQLPPQRANVGFFVNGEA